MSTKLDGEVLTLLITTPPDKTGAQSITIYRLKGKLAGNSVVGAYADELVR